MQSLANIICNEPSRKAAEREYGNQARETQSFGSRQRIVIAKANELKRVDIELMYNQISAESKHAMKRKVEFRRTKEVDYDFSSESKSISESET